MAIRSRASGSERRFRNGKSVFSPKPVSPKPRAPGATLVLTTLVLTMELTLMHQTLRPTGRQVIEDQRAHSLPRLQMLVPGVDIGVAMIKAILRRLIDGRTDHRPAIGGNQRVDGPDWRQAAPLHGFLGDQ